MLTNNCCKIFKITNILVGDSLLRGTQQRCAAKYSERPETMSEEK